MQEYLEYRTNTSIHVQEYLEYNSNTSILVQEYLEKNNLLRSCREFVRECQVRGQAMGHNQGQAIVRG